LACGQLFIGQGSALFGLSISLWLTKPTYWQKKVGLILWIITKIFDLAGGHKIVGTWRSHAPLAAVYRARLCLVRTIDKPLAYIINLLAEKSGINFADYYKDD
jgi:hypothetical protein